jgi:hypothetical protein
MSWLGRWSLGIGLGLLAVAVVLLVLDVIAPGVIIAILGLIGVGMAGYDALYEALSRAQLRRRAAKSRREG